MKLRLRLFGIWLLLGCAQLAWSQPAGPKVDRVDIQYVGPKSVSEQFIRANISLKAGDNYTPNLTENDKSKMGTSGGPITQDNTSVEYYCTIFTIIESPVGKGVIWTGSDDGLVQVTRDGGKKWDNVTPPGMPEWIRINSIDASPHDAGTAYVAATNYQMDDFRPYL